MSEFQRVCAVEEIVEGSALHVDVEDTPVAVVRSGGEFYAIYDVCSHADIPLSEGEVEGCTIECWLHGSRFDLRTGKPTGLPATVPVPTYPVRVQDGDLYLSLAGGDAGSTTDQE
jgi:3-phenylpropionate/trans-cinnamate dioxygenase ferredoxin subunit